MPLSRKWLAVRMGHVRAMLLLHMTGGGNDERNHVVVAAAAAGMTILPLLADRSFSNCFTDAAAVMGCPNFSVAFSGRLFPSCVSAARK
jgi:hypothetical protein